MEIKSRLLFCFSSPKIMIGAACSHLALYITKVLVGNRQICRYRDSNESKDIEKKIEEKSNLVDQQEFKEKKCQVSIINLTFINFY